MANGETEEMGLKTTASVFLRMLKRFWCVLRYVFRLLFGRVGLAILLVLLLADYLLESKGVSGKVLDWCLHSQNDGMHLQCKSIYLGVIKGIELHGVEIEMNTKAGPLVIHARRARAQMNWLRIFGKGGWIPQAITVSSVTLDLSGSEGESVLPCSINEGTLKFTDDDQLRLDVNGESLGIKLELDGIFKNARHFLATYKGDDKPVVFDPELAAQIEKVGEKIRSFRRLSEDSSINVSLQLDFNDLLSGNVDCRFNLSDWFVNGVVISKFRGQLKGNMHEINLNDLDIVLNRSETIGGSGNFYLQANEIEADIEASMTLATICRLSGIDTKDWLTHRVRIPPLKFSVKLPRCEIDISQLSPSLECELTSSFEAFDIDVESGGFTLSYKNNKVFMEDVSFVLSKDGRERLNGQMSLDLNNLQADGCLWMNLNCLERLKKYDVNLPEGVLAGGDKPTEIDVILEMSPLDWRQMTLIGKLEDKDLSLLEQSCRLKAEFELDNGKADIAIRLDSSPLDWYQKKLNDILEDYNFRPLMQIYRRMGSEPDNGAPTVGAVENSDLYRWENSIGMNIFCDIAGGLSKRAFDTDFEITVLTHDDSSEDLTKESDQEEKRELKTGLYCNGTITYKLDGHQIGLSPCSGECHPDWLYRNYCRKLVLSTAYIFDLFGTTDIPVEFSLELPEISLENIDKWKMFATVKGYDSHFGVFNAKEIACEVIVNSSEVDINNITATTQEDEHLRLDIHVQYSPLEFSIKDLKLEGNPALAEAFILDDEAQSFYRQIWSDVKWDEKQKPLVRMPSLIYKDGSPWSLSLIANIDATTQDNDKLNLDLGVQYSPLEFFIRNLELKGNPAVAEAFIPNNETKTVYRQIWSKVKWDEKKKPMVRMPTLIYKEGPPWSLTLTANVNAEDASYNGYVFDDLNLIISLDMPSSLSVRPITYKTSGGNVYGEVSVTFDGVPHCTFKIDGDNGYLNPKALLTAVNPEFGAYLKDIDFDDKSRLSLEGEMFLSGDPRISLSGSLSCPKLTWHEKMKTNLNYELKDIESDWSYSANGIAWNVTKSTFLDGNVRTSGIYELANSRMSLDSQKRPRLGDYTSGANESSNSRGEFLLLFDGMPFSNVYNMLKKLKKDDAAKSVQEIDKPKPGLVSGECHGRFLYGWAGRPLHLKGDGHVAIREADMWNDVPLLAQLRELLPGGKKSKAALGNITQMDADIEFLGNRLSIPQLYTNGTIMALHGNGEYGLESGKMKFKMSGVPLQEVGILSLALSPLTWAFQAEIDESMNWRLKSGLMQLFYAPKR